MKMKDYPDAFCALYSCFFDDMHYKHIWNKPSITTEWVWNLWDVPRSISPGSCRFFFLSGDGTLTLSEVPWWHILSVMSWPHRFLQTCYIKRGLQKLSEGKTHPFPMSSTVWSLKSSPSTSLSLLCANIAFDLGPLEIRTCYSQYHSQLQLKNVSIHNIIKGAC